MGPVKNAYLPSMRKVCICGVSAALLLLTEASFAGVIKDTAGLRREIMAVYARQPKAEFALAFEDLSTGEQFFINEHESFHAASTMKTPVLIETYRQIAQHK
jgi:beta-lactamase class A